MEDGWRKFKKEKEISNLFFLSLSLSLILLRVSVPPWPLLFSSLLFSSCLSGSDVLLKGAAAEGQGD